MTHKEERSEMNAAMLAMFKNALREIIANNGYIPDQESFDLVQKVVPWPAVEVCLMNGRGELLLHKRHFKEWPGELSQVDDWYIPGGYMTTHGTIEACCQRHLEKDGVTANFEYQVETAGVYKWAPGEHPLGHFPLSVLCVCRLRGEATFRPGTEHLFRFTDIVVPTAVPAHTKLQEMVFWWRNHHLNLFSRAIKRGA